MLLRPQFLLGLFFGLYEGGCEIYYKFAAFTELMVTSINLYYTQGCGLHTFLET